MAIADVYDALISKRVYKEPYHHQKALAIVNEGRGSHFDPDMIDVFNEIADDIRKIALAYADHDDERKMLLKGMKDVNILIVEDQEVNAEVLMKQVELLGFKVDVAANGREAVRLMSNEFYIAILTDINMPIMDGYQLLEFIRKKYGQIAVIAVTGETESIDSDKAFRKGFDGYIKKPVNQSELRSVLECYIPLDQEEGSIDSSAIIG